MRYEEKTFPQFQQLSRARGDHLMFGQPGQNGLSGFLSTNDMYSGLFHVSESVGTWSETFGRKWVSPFP